jgi:hypothetical protein
MIYRFRYLRMAGLLAPAMLFFVTVMSLAAEAQTITIRLLNGKTGKPISNQNVTIRWAGDSMQGTVVAVNHKGIGRVEIRPGEASFALMEGPRNGKEADRVAYIDCNEHTGTLISVSRVMETGFVPGNSYGDHTFQTHPGEVVFWGLPRPWWKPDMQ